SWLPYDHSEHRAPTACEPRRACPRAARHDSPGNGLCRRPGAVPGVYGRHQPGGARRRPAAETLSEFFRTGGWGRVTITPVGTGALAIDSPDWAEAQPGTAQTPMCFFSAGMLADFLGRISDETIAVMEVECRTRGDARCRFLSATPHVLDKVYNEMTAGRSYVEALSA